MPTIKPSEIAEEGDVSGVETTEDDELEHRSAMEDAYDRAMAAAGDDDGEEVTPDLEDEPEPRAAKERERDETGRFKTKKSKLAQVSGADETIEQPRVAARESQQTETPVFAPPSWAADEREAFASAPRKAQEAITRREQESRRAIHQATEQAAQVERTWGEVRQAIGDERINQFGRRGITPGAVVKQLMHWQDYLDSNPQQALSDLAQSYGLNFQQLAQHQAQQPQEPAYVRELRQQVNQVTGLLTQQQQQSQAQAQRGIESEIHAFAGETDVNGAALRPHIEHVIDDMLPIVAQLRGTGIPVRQLLQTAYDKAIWANPSTRELELRKTQTAAKPNLEKARQASKLVNGAARSFVADDPTDSRSAMAAIYDKYVK